MNYLMRQAAGGERLMTQLDIERFRKFMKTACKFEFEHPYRQFHTVPVTFDWRNCDNIVALFQVTIDSYVSERV